MTDRPILFSVPMVRALLAGTKTQTRRAIPEAMQYTYDNYDDWCSNVSAGVPTSRQFEREFFLERIRIQPGDRLWVRETWAHYHTVNHIRRPEGGAFSEISDGLAGYRADGHDTIEDFREHVRLMSGCDLEAVEINGDRWRPSIHMPRWASRLTLYVSDVRVERLQDISEADARAEGAGLYVPGHGFIAEDELRADPGYSNFLAPRLGFEAIWTEINGAESWAENPWVAAYTFAVRLGNIDTLPATLEEAA